jgi:hypothetical protein
MAKLTIEIDTNEIDTLKLLAHRDEIISAIHALTVIRWKHIESVDEAREEVRRQLEGLYELFYTQ